MGQTSPARRSCSATSRRSRGIPMARPRRSRARLYPPQLPRPLERPLSPARSRSARTPTRSPWLEWPWSARCSTRRSRKPRTGRGAHGTSRPHQSVDESLREAALEGTLHRSGRGPLDRSQQRSVLLVPAYVELPRPRRQARRRVRVQSRAILLRATVTLLRIHTKQGAGHFGLPLCFPSLEAPACAESRLIEQAEAYPTEALSAHSVLQITQAVHVIAQVLLHPGRQVVVVHQALHGIDGHVEIAPVIIARIHARLKLVER